VYRHEIYEAGKTRMLWVTAKTGQSQVGAFGVRAEAE
jgi:hypothetical protein